MHRSPRFRVHFVAAAIAASSLAMTGEAPAVQTEELLISAGCPEDTPGTCTSTRWLGTDAGDATSNFITAVTPVDEVFFRAEGSLNWRDYPGDETVGEYHLSGDPIEVVVSLAAEGVGVQTMVHARIHGRIDGKWVTLTAEPQTVNLLPVEETPVTFTFEVAESAGLLFSDPTFEVAVHGVNLSAGHVNQQGGSTFTIPYVIPEDPADAS